VKRPDYNAGEQIKLRYSVRHETTTVSVGTQVTVLMAKRRAGRWHYDVKLVDGRVMKDVAEGLLCKGEG
jgi:hypothetical protein